MSYLSERTDNMRAMPRARARFAMMIRSCALLLFIYDDYVAVMRKDALRAQKRGCDAYVEEEATARFKR